MKTILVPIDFSHVTKQLVVQAASLARELGARVVLLNVTTQRAEFADHAAFVKTISHFERRNVNNSLKTNQSDGRSAPKQIQGVSLQLIGDAVEVILQQAKKLSADFIVMGSHGHTALHELVVGSTTGGVLRGAKCPVVIIPPCHSAKIPTRNHAVTWRWATKRKRGGASRRVRRLAAHWKTR